jgi:hypothetical protein
MAQTADDGKEERKSTGRWPKKRGEEAKKGHFLQNGEREVDPVIDNSIDGVSFVIQKLVFEPVSAGAVPLRGMGCGAEHGQGWFSP